MEDAVPAGQQGMPVYVTSLPTNLQSGLKPQDQEHRVYYARETRSLLCPTHPRHINDTNNRWNWSLADLIQDPPGTFLV